jgi:membrane protease YdiL (CAAX protease family)
MDDSIKQQVNQSTGEYLLFTLYWLAFFLLVLPIPSNVILSLLDDGSLLFNSNAIYLFISTFLTAVLTLPFLKFTLDAQNKSDVIGRLAIKKVALFPLIITVLLTAAYVLLEQWLFGFMEVAVPDFTLEIKAQTNSLLDKILLLLAVGFIGPIYEEVVFRGVAFYRLKKTALGASGAIIIPSIVFTLIHWQYDQVEIFISVFVFSCLVGLLRHLSGNLWYCIIAHMICNLLALGEIIWWY